MATHRARDPRSNTDDLIAIDAAPDLEIAAEPGAESGAGLEAPDTAGQTAKTVAPAPRTASGGRPFRHHEIPFGDGKLILDRDGSIRTMATDGSVTASWQPDDPEWSRHAIRFGLRPSASGGSSIPGHPPQRAKRPRT
jgi:hypothetical protein